jgi:hypothetical protein
MSSTAGTRGTEQPPGGQVRQAPPGGQEEAAGRGLVSATGW